MRVLSTTKRARHPIDESADKIGACAVGGAEGAGEIPDVAQGSAVGELLLDWGSHSNPSGANQLQSPRVLGI